MTIRHLEIFIAVVDCGKMRSAAEKLYISQPSVSQAINELETFYNVKLFERLSRKLYITDSGKKLLKHARYIVEAFREMNQEMINKGNSQKLRIGSSVTVGIQLLSKLVKVYEEMYPSYTTHIEINNTSTIENMLLRSDLDIGLIEGEVLSQDLIRVPICKDHLVLISGMSHPFATKNYVTIEELEGQDFISREEGSMNRNLLENLIKDEKINVNKRWVSTNTEAIKEAVMHGLGIAFVSSLLIKEELKQKKLKVITIKDVNITRDICLVYHKNKYLSDAFMDFQKLCMDQATNFFK